MIRQGGDMKINPGSVIRLLRLILGLVIITLGIITRSWWGLIGLFPLMTAAMNYCPLCSLFAKKK